ncbi:MAG: DinB family protein [Acidimicrobiia bacterium]|nr:DinB family protein [Acidimicrobiia bacterium]MDH5521345.1 DinB family protein [Acidimicrobiia bacterium]
MNLTLSELLVEYDRAVAWTDSLWTDLSPAQVAWRPEPDSSAIGWHLGHQAAVAHYLIRNLTAAEQSPDPDLDGLMDSATPEPDRGDLPDVDRIARYRSTVADRVRFRIGQIDDGRVGAPAQLRLIAGTLLTAVVNHEYQHSKWIGEVRAEQHGLDVPPPPSSQSLTVVDGYSVLAI